MKIQITKDAPMRYQNERERILDWPYQLAHSFVASSYPKLVDVTSGGGLGHLKWQLFKLKKPYV